MVSPLPELRKVISERYAGWAEGWGLSLAYAVTQSLELSENIISETLVALIASDEELQQLAREDWELAPGWPAVPAGLASDDRIDSEEKRKAKTKRRSEPKLPATVNRVRFAAAVWDAARARSFHGYAQDPFFKMNAVTRAAVILKVRGAFTNGDIAAALKISSHAVEENLETARLWYSDGKPWVKTVPSPSECTQWNANSQLLWSHYLAKELDADTEQKVHAHLIACSACRTSFTQFKERYASWFDSVPTVEADQRLKSYISDVAEQAFRTHERRGPSPWPGVRKMLANDQFQAVAFLSGLFLVIKWLFF